MPTQRTILKLSDVNGFVRDLLDAELPDDFWIEAEIAEMNERGGHCYLTLVEKDEHSHTPIARAGARCWRSTWTMVRDHFLHVTGTPMRAGMKVLLLAHAQFHEAYGFSWIITDIDPTYTLGDLARRRKEIIARLKAEGVIDLNKQLELSPFAQRIAVVSSETAAGYGDFVRQLHDNQHHFAFITKLFPAIMQGEQVETSIIRALTAICENDDDYDAVVIIRGGGSTADLSGFDTLRLAEHVANFPLPVITGIGHDRDESVLDIIAHSSVKTPTAAAELLIGNLLHTAGIIAEAEQTVVRCVQQRIEHEQLRMTHLVSTLPHIVRSMLQAHNNRLDRMTTRMATAIPRHLYSQSEHLTELNTRMSSTLRQHMQQQHHHLDMLAQQLQALDPQRLLNRGYSITTHNGHAVKDSTLLQHGDIILTRTAKGTITSVVNKKNRFDQPNRRQTEGNGARSNC